MEKVIPSHLINNNRVITYGFKPLGNAPLEADEFQSGITIREHHVEPIRSSVVEMPPTETKTVPKEENEHDNLIETLLKKVDELSTSLIKMEMQLEKQQGEFNVMLKEEAERAFKDGFTQGELQTQKGYEEQMQALRIHYSDAAQKLIAAEAHFDTKIAGLEKELILTALSIAKEVIVSEIHDDSASIAAELAKKLLADVASASKITVRVNPSDYEYLRQTLSSLQNSETIVFISDPVIAQGGVVIYSDAANIDGTVMTRYENIKAGVLAQKGK